MSDVFADGFTRLLPEHLAILHASGIADEVIRERGYESILGAGRLRDLGFAEYQARKPGLLLPGHTTDGGNGICQYRPDHPRVDRRNPNKVYKYETPAAQALRLDVPPRCRPALGDPATPLWITEGIKKADAGASRGLCVVAVLGVWGFRGRNDLGGTTWLADWQSITLQGRPVNICFDSDVMTNPKVKVALDLLAETLARKGASVRHVLLPGGPDGAKVGLDDFLLTRDVDDLARFAVTPTYGPPPPTPAVVRRLAPGDDRHLSDTGNAYRLVALRGNDLRYVFAWDKWLAWDGRRWTPDQHGRVVTWAKETVRGIYAEARAAGDPEQARTIAEWALTSESAARVDAMIRLARNELAVIPDDLDRDPLLFNVANGTIDLRAGVLREHRRDDLLTKLADVPFAPDAPCPTWTAFLETIIPDAEVRTFLRRAVGYSLTGDISEQVLLFLHGKGANGKSTFLNAVMGILGDYAKQAAAGLLIEKPGGESHPTELADLFGVRFLSLVEVGEGKRMAEALLKHITGGDRIRARRMREDFWEFGPTHKIWLAANHKLVVKGTDDGIWRRVRLVPFEITIPERARDKHLSEKLTAESSGILAWAVGGYLAWQSEGLPLPRSVLAATDTYRAEMDVLAAFLADCCVVKPGHRIAKGALYKAYREWCEASGERSESQRALSGRMLERGFGEMRGAGGLHLWLGLGLAATPDHDANTAPEFNRAVHENANLFDEVTQ